MLSFTQFSWLSAIVISAVLTCGSSSAEYLKSSSIPLKLRAQIKAGDVANSNGLDPATLTITPPSNLKWSENPNNGVLTSVVLGDPNKSGLYIVLVRWPAHKMSHPHFHPNDRFVTVLSGTWWVGTGPKFDPDHTVPVKAGSFVTHYGKRIHYDGAKDEDCVLEIVGMGPATVTPAEKK